MYYLNNYPIDPNLNYLVYYRGNFGPPTKGHYSLVELLADHPNVKYFIHQIGKRHGFPYDLNRKVFKIYLKPFWEKIILKQMASSLEILNYIEGIDKVILIRGAESVEPLANGEGKAMFKDMRERYRPLGEALARRKIKLDFLFVDRPQAETLSATKFTEALTNGRRNLRKFVPEHVRDKDFRYIVDKYRSYL